MFVVIGRFNMTVSELIFILENYEPDSKVAIIRDDQITDIEDTGIEIPEPPSMFDEPEIFLILKTKYDVNWWRQSKVWL